MPSSKSLRLFVGLTVPDLLAQQLVLLGGGIEGARWETPEKLHLTLRFIGDIDGGTRATIDEALRTVTFDPFELALHGCGHFPPRGEPRALWLGIRDSPPLLELRGRIENALRDVGLDPDPRNFAPHLTLARLRRPPAKKVAAWLSMHAMYEAPPFVVEQFALFSSVLGPRGSKYAVIESYRGDGSR